MKEYNLFASKLMVHGPNLWMFNYQLLLQLEEKIRLKVFLGRKEITACHHGVNANLLNLTVHQDHQDLQDPQDSLDNQDIRDKRATLDIPDKMLTHALVTKLDVFLVLLALQVHQDMMDMEDILAHLVNLDSPVNFYHLDHLVHQDQLERLVNLANLANRDNLDMLANLVKKYRLVDLDRKDLLGQQVILDMMDIPEDQAVQDSLDNQVLLDHRANLDRMVIPDHPVKMEKLEYLEKTESIVHALLEVPVLLVHHLHLHIRFNVYGHKSV